MSRPALAFVLAATVVLAGCGAFADRQPAEETSSPPEPSTFTPIGGMVTATGTAGATETPGTGATAGATPATDSPAGSSSRVAPGVTQGGVHDPLALARAHSEMLSATTYTYVSETVVRAENGTRLGRIRRVQRVGPGGRFEFTGRLVGTLPPEFAVHYETDVYSNGSLVVARFFRPGDRFAATYPPEEAPITASSSRKKGFIYTVFSDLNATIAMPVGRGTATLYWIHASGTDLRFTSVEASNVTASALIDSRGLVHELHLEYDATRGEWSGRIERTIRYTDVGNTTVTRPGWVDEAVGNATRQDT